MKLLKLELSGFKSFADHVTLQFEHGVTAIVGPNGCGKSNVSDAVRWVLGETSARHLRGGKMEDVIFQGSVNRRPVNLTEVSLHLDNTSGDLPVAYQEVVITRRLTRSGQSEYFINRNPVRLRDVNDLLRGTGLGSDAGVVMEAKMIDLLLSDRAEERRSLFEEAAGIGLYRDRKHSTERRLEETATDLQRLEDVMAEVQSQIRSLARQKGKAERHAKLMEEKFSVQLSLAQQVLADLTDRASGMTARHRELSDTLPALREQLEAAVREQEERARQRSAAEERRAATNRDLAQAQVALGKLDADLAVASERLSNVKARQVRDQDELRHATARTEQATIEREQAAAERGGAQAEHDNIRQQLLSRAQIEEEVKARLASHREQVRRLEQEVQASAQSLRSLEGERNALEGELTSIHETLAQRQAQCTALEQDYSEAESRALQAEHEAKHRAEETLVATTAADRARQLVEETREREAAERDERRTAEESLAQLTARRQALEELERDRVGLAPGAAALMAVRSRFGDGVLGPLSDFLSTSQDDAELVERVLSEWMHAVLVRDWSTVEAIQSWYDETQPGALLLLPMDPGPTGGGVDQHPLASRVSAEGPAVAWISRLLTGLEVLEPAGRILKRATGAVLLTGGAAPSGSIRRRAELAALTNQIARVEAQLAAITARAAETKTRLTELDQALKDALTVLEQAREQERTAAVARDDAERMLLRLTQERDEAASQLGRLRERIDKAERRLAEVGVAIRESEARKAEQEERLGNTRLTLAAIETEQETARESRLQWQVEEAHVTARLKAAGDRLTRAADTIDSAQRAAATLESEIQQLAQESIALITRHTEWQEQRQVKLASLQALEALAAEAESALAQANAGLETAERAAYAIRRDLESAGDEFHRLEVELTEVSGERRSIVDRVETEWHTPIDDLFAKLQPLELDREGLEAELTRIVQALESIGPVNPLAVEEHSEEVKRHEFLTTQRDDLVAARQSLLQAIREIDGTARTLFVDTFTAVQANFHKVFQTLFGGGECDIRLTNPDDPLGSEIEIHAAPRGKKTQRIHLLSSGERTLVAVSLLFSIYLTKPSPFCLMDEVDAPLDDSNVGRFTNLLHEFKSSTQFVVITHNPRTMQAADAVFGVTMQEPGVSTIVGVRLGEKAA